MVGKMAASSYVVNFVLFSTLMINFFGSRAQSWLITAAVGGIRD